MSDYLKISQKYYVNLIGRTSKVIKKDFLIYREQMIDEIRFMDFKERGIIFLLLLIQFH